MSVLNNLEGVSGQGELFLPRPPSQERRWDSDFAWPRYVEFRDRSGSRRPFSVYRYLSDLYASPGSVGFKLMYSQLKSFPEILPFLVREKIDDTHVHWVAEIRGEIRGWTTEITEQQPDEKVAWKTIDGEVKNDGVVSFEQLAPDQTRVNVQMDVEGESVSVKEGSAVFVEAGADHRFSAYEHLAVLVIFERKPA